MSGTPTCKPARHRLASMRADRQNLHTETFMSALTTFSFENLPVRTFGPLEHALRFVGCLGSIAEELYNPDRNSFTPPLL